MNNVLISDPFLYPPSGEDTQSCGGTFDVTRRDAFFEYTKRQFDIAWESTKNKGSYLFEQPHKKDWNLYIPDTPESLSPTEDDMNADQFLGTQLVEEGMSFCSNTNDVAPSADELSCSLDVGNTGESMLDSPQFNDRDLYSEQLMYLEEYLKNEKAAQTPQVADEMVLKEYFPDLTLQESSMPLTVSPEEFGIDIPPFSAEPTPSTVDQEVIVRITHITPPPQYEEAIQSSKPKRRNGRKTSLTARQCSESPGYEFGGGTVIKTEPPSPDTTQDVKPTIGCKRTKKNNANSKVTTSSASFGENTNKRVKLYELDVPNAKNAKAAFMNRQKKKEKMLTLTRENEELNSRLETQRSELEQAQQRELELQNKLEEHQRRTQAATGLNRILLSAKEVLETVMVPLHQKYGPWNLQVAPWFRNVEAAMTLTGEIPANLGGNDMTSKFITIHLNPEDRVAMVDYRPDVPVLPASMPQ